MAEKGNNKKLLKIKDFSKGLGFLIPKLLNKEQYSINL